MKKMILAFAAASTLAAPIAPLEARHHTTRHYYTTSNGVRYWRGTNGRYYCHRGNGTVGVLVGGAGGALVGAAVGHGAAPIIGAAAGALIGRHVARHQVYCH